MKAILYTYIDKNGIRTRVLCYNTSIFLLNQKNKKCRKKLSFFVDIL